MSEEQLKAFLEKIKGDISLQEKLKAAADVQAVVAIANEAGFMISCDDLKQTKDDLPEVDLSEEDLEGGVAGGKCNDPQKTVGGALFCFFEFSLSLVSL